MEETVREFFREQSIVLALLKAEELSLLFPIAPGFTQSHFLLLCLLLKVLSTAEFSLPVREQISCFASDAEHWQGREHSWLNKLPNRPSLALLNSHALLRRRPSIFQPQWWSGQHSVRSIMYKAHLLYDSLDFFSWQFTLCPTFCSHREKPADNRKPKAVFPRH